MTSTKGLYNFDLDPLFCTLKDMESVSDLLGRLSPKEPEEVTAIKRYILEQFQEPSSVSVKGETVVITVASASLANTLRLRVVALQKAAGTTKRIMFRIG